MQGIPGPAFSWDAVRERERVNWCLRVLDLSRMDECGIACTHHKLMWALNSALEIFLGYTESLSRLKIP